VDLQGQKVGQAVHTLLSPARRATERLLCTCGWLSFVAAHEGRRPTRYPAVCWTLAPAALSAAYLFRALSDADAFGAA
jgi:hypothetical protein